MSWWLKQRGLHAARFDARLIAALPQAAHSVVVQLGDAVDGGLRYWQLKTQAGVKDVAVNVVALGARHRALPIQAEVVAAFIAQSQACDLTPMYRFTVAKAVLLPSTLAYVARGITPIAGPWVYLMVPAAVVYDFTAGGNRLSVAAFVDGWPMKEAQTLSAFVLQGAPLDTGRNKIAPRALHAAHWTDPQVVALFDQPLAAIAAKQAASMFVFTDVS